MESDRINCCPADHDNCCLPAAGSRLTQHLFEYPEKHFSRQEYQSTTSSVCGESVGHLHILHWLHSQCLLSISLCYDNTYVQVISVIQGSQQNMWKLKRNTIKIIVGK